MGSFRSPLNRRQQRSDANGSVQQCGDHCECCEIKTTEETYTVSIKNCNTGSKVNVGDNVRVYRADNVNLNSKDKTVVQLERVNHSIKGSHPVCCCFRNKIVSNKSYEFDDSIAITKRANVLPAQALHE